MVAHAFNPSTWETEAGGFLSSRPPGVQSEFQDSQGYTEKTCLKKRKKKKRKEKRKRKEKKWKEKSHLEGGANVWAMEEYCLMTCSLKVAQISFYNTQDHQYSGSNTHSELGIGINNQSRRCTTDSQENLMEAHF